jgi:hypothetical protein
MSVLFVLSPAAEQVVGYSVVTPARIWATIAAFVALASVVLGWRALRSVRRAGNGGRKGAIVAVVAGLTGVVNGAVNLAVADGGLGTGNGVAGGALALVLGLIGAVLGGLALARSRRTDVTTT